MVPSPAWTALLVMSSEFVHASQGPDGRPMIVISALHLLTNLPHCCIKNKHRGS